MCADGKYMNTREAAEYIGYSVSGFKKLLSAGLIPYTKPAGRLYFRKRDLEAFMAMML